MAKIRGSKEGFPHDPSVSMPSEPKTSESNKQKIAKIHDMFPEIKKDHIARILQFYGEDEFKTMDALTRDGGIEALSNSADSSSLKSRNNKNKKKKKKTKKDSGAGMTATASFDADDSSSLHSGGNVDVDVEKECQRVENENGILADIVDETENLDSILSNHEHLNNNVVESVRNEPEKEIEPHKPEFNPILETNTPPAVLEESTSSVPIPSNCDRSIAENPTSISPLLDHSERQEEQGFKREKYRSINENYNKHPPRQRTSSFRRSKTSSLSEDSSSQHNPQAAAVPTKRGFERCKKDLNRQTISLQRIHSQLEKGFDGSEKKLTSVFADIVKQVENRQKEVELELAKRRAEAFDLLRSRQDLAVELKRRVERTPSLSEAEWSELRSDIKQFVTERKYDDDLGKTIWFQWPDISETIKSFGEVHPVKNVYSQRSHSALGDNAITNNPEPSPSSSLANEEIESSADKNDVANMADAVEEETHIVGKEETPVFNKIQSNENRTSRVFSRRSNNVRFPNNRGGYFRGNRGAGGYPRPNFNNRSNYHNNRGNYSRQNNYNNYDDYNKNRPHPERDVRMNDGPAYTGDRNMNNPRDNKMNRAHGRQYSNYNTRGYHGNNQFNRGGGNRGGQRHNVDNSETEPSTNATATNVNIDKSNIINGFVNND